MKKIYFLVLPVLISVPALCLHKHPFGLGYALVQGKKQKQATFLRQ